MAIYLNLLSTTLSLKEIKTQNRFLPDAHLFGFTSLQKALIILTNVIYGINVSVPFIFSCSNMLIAYFHTEDAIKWHPVAFLKTGFFFFVRRKKRNVWCWFRKCWIVTLNGLSLPFESFVRIKRTVKLNRNTGKVKRDTVTWPLLCPCSQTNLARWGILQRHFVSIAFSLSLSNCSFVLGYFCGKSGFLAWPVWRWME